MIGFLCIDKPENLTSQDVVFKIKKKFKIDKIGHMGTLDPMATGVLPIAIGKATRCFDYFLDKVKTYIVEFEFGYLTDTLDRTGVEERRDDFVPDVVMIKETMVALTGKYSQVPPKYSAKNIGGKRAYDLARLGVEFELKPKEVDIVEFCDLQQINDTTYSAKVTCGSGTYIRSLVRDLGEKCNALATMVNLRRVESGVFSVSNSIKLDALLTMDSLSDRLISIAEVFPKFNQYSCSESEFVKLKNGMTIIGECSEGNTLVYFGDTLMGIARVNDKHIKLSTYLM